MSHKKDAEALASALKSEGLIVEVTGGGHWEVRDPADGRRITTFSRTPGDPRWKANALRYVKQWRRRKSPPGRPPGQGRATRK